MTQARTWIGTWNNPPEPELGEETLRKLFERAKAEYCIGQLEKGENGTVHYQFVMNFKTPKKLGGLKKLSMQIHWEVCRSEAASEKYCMKEDTRLEGPWQFGQKPIQRNSAVDWEEVKEKAKAGKLDEIPADIYIRCYTGLKQIAKDHMVIEDAEHLRGIWIWGRAGVGKSRLAREKYPQAYPKLCNKWWDGYTGQEHVIMDDIGLDHRCLGQQLKIWADRYGCILETKGGAVPSKYKWFVVTSQYSIDDIWDDVPTREALHRRFKVIHMTEYDKDKAQWL